ncbi:gas vesicle protein [Streptomyces sp. NPDC059649]|uniref:gas vesicle protein n=1 Tax=Streptomyces sp. NPDC059649 TaxID=3346895 RepID=UPI0036A17C1B
MTDGAVAAPTGGPSGPDGPAGVAGPQIALIDLLDRLLNGGAVLTGDLVLSIADVDLVRISLRAVIHSIAQQEAFPWQEASLQEASTHQEASIHQEASPYEAGPHRADGARDPRPAAGERPGDG